jgi:hypothetical protein
MNDINLCIITPEYQSDWLSLNDHCGATFSPSERATNYMKLLVLTSRKEVLVFVDKRMSLKKPQNTRVMLHCDKTKKKF